MQTITITFPLAIEPHYFEHTMEEAVRQHSPYQIKVKHIGTSNGEHDYTISTEDVAALYLAGIVAGNMMRSITK